MFAKHFSLPWQAKRDTWFITESFNTVIIQGPESWNCLQFGFSIFQHVCLRPSTTGAHYPSNQGWSHTILPKCITSSDFWLYTLVIHYSITVSYQLTPQRNPPFTYNGESPSQHSDKFCIFTKEWRLFQQPEEMLEYYGCPVTPIERIV